MTTPGQNLYFQITDLWKRFCEEHQVLFDLTMDEYQALLKSDIDQVDELVAQKKQIMQKIALLEQARQTLMQEVSQQVGHPITKASELLAVMEVYEQENHQNYLQRFNNLLIDIIEKIQQQNHKNQIFINKAISSLNEIRESTSGRRFKTYTPTAQLSSATKDYFSGDKRVAKDGR